MDYWCLSQRELVGMIDVSACDGLYQNHLKYLHLEYLLIATLS